MIIKKQVKAKILEQLKREGEHKSKVSRLLKHNPKEKLEMSKYLQKLNRHDASIIFKTRTRMLDVKENYKNKYKDQKCRLCKESDETQEHVLQYCPKIHQDTSLITRDYEIHSNSSTLNKRAALKINTIMDKIKAEG